MANSIDQQIIKEYQILSKSDWDRFYPKENYAQKTEHAQTHPLHYLLALNQSDKTIIPFIMGCKKISSLSLADKTNYGFTPLIIATMRGRLEVVQLLLEMYTKHNISKNNEKDSYGWSILHHARVSSNKIFEFFKNNGFNTKVGNYLHATPDEVRSLIDYEVKPISIHRTYYETKEGKLILVSELGKEKMKELMGIEVYRDNPLYATNELKTLWQLPEMTHRSLLIENYEEYLKSPPNLIVKSCEELKNLENESLELCAGEDIKFGAIIAEYAGEIVHVEGNETENFS